MKAATLITACALFGGASMVQAQGITGTVLDASTRVPIAGAAVTVVSPGGAERIQVLTDSAGWFRALVPPGTHTLRAESFGYAPLETVPITVAEREMVTVEVRLGPRPAEIEPLVVQARERLRLTRLDEYRRRSEQSLQLGRGRIITREQIERGAGGSINQLLTRGLELRLHQEGLQRILVMRGRGDECAPAIYLDGMYMGSSVQTDLDAFIVPELVEGIEIYRSAQAPPELRTNGCGAIAVWTRSDATGPFSWRRALIGAAMMLGIILYGSR